MTPDLHMLDLIALCTHVLVMVIVIGLLLAAALVLIHDVLTGRYVHWGYWRRMLNSKPDQFAGPRKLRT